MTPNGPQRIALQAVRDGTVTKNHKPWTVHGTALGTCFLRDWARWGEDGRATLTADGVEALVASELAMMRRFRQRWGA